MVSCEPFSKKQPCNATLAEVVDTSFPDYDPLIINPGPANKEILTTNPPGFHWPPEKGSKGFILEISRDIQFEECNRLFQTAIKKED
jgi:hypothetical protein